MALQNGDFLKDLILPNLEGVNRSKMGSNSVSDLLESSNLCAQVTSVKNRYRVKRMEGSTTPCGSSYNAISILVEPVEIKLRISGDLNHWLKAVAFESNKFFLAAFETAQVLSEISKLDSHKEKYYQTDLLPRKFVKVYYATFFAIHGLLKTFGFGSVQVTKKSKEVLDNLRGASVKESVEQGFYSIQIDLGLKEVVLTAPPAGNSHERLWSMFYDDLDQKIIPMLNSMVSNKAQLAGDSFDKLIDSLETVKNIVKPSDGYKISTFRNDLNYLKVKADKLWYPSKEYISEWKDDFIKASGLWQKNSSEIIFVDNARSFYQRSFNTFKCCQFILSISREVVEEMIKSSGGVRNFHEVRSQTFFDSVESE